MGEMCDFEAKYHPENWVFPWRKSGKTKIRKSVTISMSDQEYAAYKAIGGAVGARKCIVRAAAALAGDREQS